MRKEMYDCVKKCVNVRRDMEKQNEMCELEKKCVHVERDV